MNRVRILIPAYNESEQIGRLLRALKAKGHTPVVVDDGSNDQTAREAGDAGAIVVGHKENRGKGASLQTGFDHILKEGYDAVLIMDGDAQHSADDVQRFIDLADKKQNVLIIGNRMGNTKNMPLDRKLTNMFMSFIVSCICRQKIPDSQCGFRLIKRELLQKIKIESERFEVESELLIKASRRGTEILSIPIDTFYGKESSQINPFLDTFRFIVFLLKLPFIR
ncbi:MAG: glycosyltransferase family 2 protein [Candidatus Omnitrophica bacterium]|nr:glycosyltransferase family 2 protein [Candidatus Omnitrophota bacterium]